MANDAVSKVGFATPGVHRRPRGATFSLLNVLRMGWGDFLARTQPPRCLMKNKVCGKLREFLESSQDLSWQAKVSAWSGPWLPLGGGSPPAMAPTLPPPPAGNSPREARLTAALNCRRMPRQDARVVHYPSSICVATGGLPCCRHPSLDGE
jgi:hypothetical protein